MCGVYALFVTPACALAIAVVVRKMASVGELSQKDRNRHDDRVVELGSDEGQEKKA